MTVSIVGLDRADVLAALYNASKPQGMGFLHYEPVPMGREEAEALLKEQTHFDYLKGRVMKLDLSCKIGDAFDAWGYDRDNGNGAAERAIASLRNSNNTNSKEIATTHEQSTLKSAEDVKGRLREKSKFTSSNTLHMGLDDVKDVLAPAVDKAVQSQPTKQN